MVTLGDNTVNDKNMAVYNTENTKKVRYPLYIFIQNVLKARPELKPENPDDVAELHALLDTKIREELSWSFGSRLAENFDEAVKLILSQIYHVEACRGFYTENDVKRLIGTEIGWIEQFNRSAERDPLGMQDRAKLRDNFICHMMGGFNPLTDPNSPTRRMIELDKYMTSWADFPAFGFGIPALDRATGGIMPGEICVLTGAPGTMKTSLALNAADDAINKKRSKNNIILYFSVDMKPRDISMRLLEREAKIPETQLRAMIAAGDERVDAFKNRIYEKYDGKMAIFGHKTNEPMTVKNALNRCLIRRPGLVIIDYLTRLKAAGQSDLEFVEQAVPAILSFAQQYDTAFLIVSQMARASRSEQASGRTGGHSRGGGIIEELANTEIELFQQFAGENGENGENARKIDLSAGFNYNLNFNSDLNLNSNLDTKAPLQPQIIACITKARRGIAGQSFSLGYQGDIKLFDGTARRMKPKSSKKALFTASDPL